MFSFNSKKYNILLMLLFSFSCYAKQVSTVAITTIVEHPSLNDIKNGVIDELENQNYKIGKDILINYQSAHGSSANAAQIAKQFVSNKPDVIVAITTPSAQSMAAATKVIPILFSGVTDPIAAKLIKNWQPAKNNISGVSNYLEIIPQAEFIVKTVPNIKTLGIIFSPHEINSTIMLKNLEKALKKYNVKILAVPAQRTADIPSAIKSLQGKIDAIYTTTDNNVVSAYDSLVKFANETKTPLLASFLDAIYRGASAAYGINDYEVGRETGKYVIRILKGEKVGDLPPITVKEYRLVLNLNAANKQNLILSKSLLDDAFIKYEENKK